MKKEKILIIDDEPNIIMMIRSRLKSVNYEVISALNGEEGLRKAREEKPDLILLDVTMPGISGFEVLAKLKLNPETKSIPIIMLTAQGATQAMLKAQSLGATDYIIKPFKGEDLIKYIRRSI
ncbi:MAG: response regulator [Candidatus Omnitrophota bacterium]